jgi:hypothetical protein
VIFFSARYSKKDAARIERELWKLCRRSASERIDDPLRTSLSEAAPDSRIGRGERKRREEKGREDESLLSLFSRLQA